MLKGRFCKFLILFLLLVAAGASRAPGQVSGAASRPLANAAKPRYSFAAIRAEVGREDFAGLDGMASEFRSDTSRADGGDWQLWLFYSALNVPFVTEGDGARYVGHLEHWVQQRPDSITARVALATSLMRWAEVANGIGEYWRLRVPGGHGWSDRMTRAKEVLRGAEHLAPMCPQWYLEMMILGTREGWPAARVDALFQQGVQFAPDYFYLYRQQAEAIWVRDRGSSKKSTDKTGQSLANDLPVSGAGVYNPAMDLPEVTIVPSYDERRPSAAAAYASSAADSKAASAGATAGDELYYQIATKLLSHAPNNFPLRQMDWKRIERGQAALAAVYGTSGEMFNEMAFMAYLYKDKETARQEFALLGDQWLGHPWPDHSELVHARRWSKEH